MKKIITCTIMFLTVYGSAQTPDIGVEWGHIIKTKDAHFNEFIGVDEKFFYTVGDESRGRLAAMFDNGIIIKRYDRKTFTENGSWAIPEFKFKGSSAVYSCAKLHTGEIHLYFVVYNAELESKFLILRKMDDMGQLGEVVEMANYKTDKSLEGRFEIKTSMDSTKMLLFADIPTEKHENEKFGLQVFDHDNQVLLKKHITLPYTDKFFTIEDYAVTNSGDVLLLGYAEPNRYRAEKKEKKSPNRDYKLLLVNQEIKNDEITEIDLGLKDRYINSITISPDFKNGTMAAAGFYSDKSFGIIGGSFFITLDQQNLETTTVSSQPFSEEFLKNFLSEKKVEKGWELAKYVFRDFLQRDDGGAIIVAEQHYIYNRTSTTSNGVTSYDTYYVYNNIIVLNLNPDGSLEWAKYIPKFQTTANDKGFYNGYLLLVKGDRLHFIYNDDRKNLERKAKGEDLYGMGLPSKSASIIVTIDSKGDISYDQLFRNQDFKAIMVPRKSFSTTDNKVIIYGVKGSKTRFGNMSFL